MEQKLRSERVFIAPGGKPSIFFAIMMFGQPGVEIIYPEPGFPVYESVINYSGAQSCSNVSFRRKKLLI